jgi:hypothetical protein
VYKSASSCNLLMSVAADCVEGCTLNLFSSNSSSLSLLLWDRSFSIADLCDAIMYASTCWGSGLVVARATFACQGRTYATACPTAHLWSLLMLRYSSLSLARCYYGTQPSTTVPAVVDIHALVEKGAGMQRSSHVVIKFKHVSFVLFTHFAKV